MIEACHSEHSEESPVLRSGQHQMDSHKINDKQLFILSLLMVLGAVNSCAYTPAIPAISDFFHQPIYHTQLLVVISLLGHAIGPLLSVLFSNLISRLRSASIGLMICMGADLACIASWPLHHFSFLIVGIFLLSVGGNMSLSTALTLVKDRYVFLLEKPLALTTLAFAIFPGLFIFIASGILDIAAWPAIFMAMGVFHGWLYWKIHACHSDSSLRWNDNKAEILCCHSRESGNPLACHSDSSLRWNDSEESPVRGLSFHILKQKTFWLMAALAGCFSGMLYSFSAFAPRIAMHELGASNISFGLWSNLPSAGMIVGSLIALQFLKKDWRKVLNYAIGFSIIGILLLWTTLYFKLFNVFWFFTGVSIIYIGMQLAFPFLASQALNVPGDHASKAAFFTILHFLIASQLVNLANHLPFNSITNLLSIFVVCIVVISTIRFSFYFVAGK